jgi:hypothetical protein
VAWQWHEHLEATGQTAPAWQAYAACGVAGAVLFAAAVVPLAKMADLPLASDASPVAALRWQQLLRPLVDRRFRRLMAFGAWHSFSNGIIQAAQNKFPIDVLGFSFAEKRMLDGGSRGVQAALLPTIGGVVDRRGNVPILAAAQGVISLAPLFFLLATPEAKWWLLGAYAAWLAYGGQNVTLPNLMLGLSPRRQRAAYAAAWFAWTQLAYAVSVLAGGWLLDWLAARLGPREFAGLTVDHYLVLFAASCVLKMCGVPLALRVPEPRKN